MWKLVRGALFALAVYEIVASLPDIRRYLRITMM